MVSIACVGGVSSISSSGLVNKFVCPTLTGSCLESPSDGAESDRECIIGPIWGPA